MAQVLETGQVVTGRRALGEVERRLLRQVGEWQESGWEYESQPGFAVKRYGWTHRAVVKATGDEVTLAYWTSATVKVSAMESVELVDSRNTDGARLLELVVQKATEGVGYVARVDVGRSMLEAAKGVVRGWIERGGYDEQWEVELEGAFRAGAQAASAMIAWAKKAGAVEEGDPVLRTFGWAVAIEAVAVPRVVLA